jgi:uroporphyrin-III C-methyltransferase
MRRWIPSRSEGALMMAHALVSFVGAGPGDPELITLKALRRLRDADAVIHDRLIPDALLDEVPVGAEIIDVGKAPGRPCVGQGHINWMIVDAARRHRRVVRLKGGDPGIFGRLAEEIDAVRAAGLAFEIVPGVTAATAAAARAGISLTERGSASTVVLSTGTGQNGSLPETLDWSFLARVEGTLVFYMPVASLDAITSALTILGRDPREPALVVEAAGLPDERVIAARLGEIGDRAREAAVRSPALFITGPTVAAASVPLAVRRVLAAAG